MLILTGTYLIKEQIIKILSLKVVTSVHPTGFGCVTTTTLRHINFHKCDVNMSLLYVGTYLISLQYAKPWTPCGYFSKPAPIFVTTFVTSVAKSPQGSIYVSAVLGKSFM